MESKRSKKGRRARPGQVAPAADNPQQQQQQPHHPWDEGRPIKCPAVVTASRSAPQISRALRIRRVGAVSHRIACNEYRTRCSFVRSDKTHALVYRTLLMIACQVERQPKTMTSALCFGAAAAAGRRSPNYKPVCIFLSKSRILGSQSRCIPAEIGNQAAMGPANAT